MIIDKQETDAKLDCHVGVREMLNMKNLIYRDVQDGLCFHFLAQVNFRKDKCVKYVRLFNPTATKEK